MANTDLNFTASWSGLSMPKVRLASWNTTTWQTVTIDWYKYWGNVVGGQFSLFRYPEVVTQDLTDEQIEKGVWVEMLTYHRGKWFASVKNTDAAYKVPSSRVGWVNTLQQEVGGTIDSRGWTSHIHWNMWGWLLAVDRPNHYRVTARNEVVPVWQYLNNRMSVYDVAYNDATNNWNSIGCLCPSQWIRRFANYSWSRFGYSAAYTPFYFRFRYIMKDENGFWFISWPMSPIIKMTQDNHPFEFDAVASTNYWATCLNLNPLATWKEARCTIETKLP